jgi:uncharacterized protein with FMN-binding domain
MAKKNVIARIFLLVLLVMLVPQLLFPAKSVEAASKVSISATTVSLRMNETYTLCVVGTANNITWSSSNTKVATVNSYGVVTGKNVGTCSINAKVGTKAYTCKVTVTKLYTDGTYTGTGTGFRNGTTKVSIKIKNDAITSISVTSNQDTPRFFNSARSTIISEILKAQSTNVDAVSGATYSSYGIMDAVANAISKAK